MTEPAAQAAQAAKDAQAAQAAKDAQAAQAAKDEQDAPDTPPPVMGSWRNLYIALLGELAALVALFYALTRWAS